MALVLYGPYGDAVDAVKGSVTKQYYTVNANGTDWVINTSGNKSGVEYANTVRSQVIP
jgi:hypothetical protein